MVSDQRATGASPRVEWLLDRLLTGDPSTDPYDSYRLIQQCEPVLRTRAGTLVLSRFNDIDTAFRNHDLGRDERAFGTEEHLPEDDVRRAMVRWRQTAIFTNPPAHTRLRRLVSEAFTARHVERLRGSIGELADGCLDRLGEEPEVDFMRTVAIPLPVAVIAALLGISAAESLRLAPLVHDVTAIFEPFLDPGTARRAYQAQTELAGYLGECLAHRQRHPGDDLFSRMVASRAADALSDDEMVSTAILLFVAGFETTSSLLGNGLHALLTHPDQLDALRRDPGLVPRAVEECLRYDAPIQLPSRTVLRACSIAGESMYPGQTVLMLVGAANRDPERFTEPDRFDVTRDEGTSLAFASGIHFCLGAPLARLEAAEAFTRMLRRYPRIRLAGQPTRRPRRSHRIFAELRISVDGSAVAR
jgi:cytochrome P450